MCLTQSFTANTMSSGNAQIGKPAPDFKATAVVGGQFKEIKLSDYLGNKVLFIDVEVFAPFSMTIFQQHTQC